MRIVPAPAVRLMKRRASSRSGVNCQLLNSKENERDTWQKRYENMKVMNERSDCV